MPDREIPRRRGVTEQPVRLLVRGRHAEPGSGSGFLRGGTASALPDYAANLRDDFRTLLRADLRVAAPESSPFLELRSGVDDRSVYFHPPSAAILVYDRPQDDAALLDAHHILLRHPSPTSRLAPNQPIGSIEYYATGACNLRCGYCYLGPLAEAPAPADLDPAPFLRRVAQLLAEGRIAPRLRVAIIGGEPLLVLPGLRQAVSGLERLAKHHGVSVSFGLTTNGHRLDEDAAEFLRAHHIAVKISYDGQDNERNRPARRAAVPSSSLDLSRLRRLTDGIPVTLNATLLPPQFDSQADVLAELIGAGFSRVQISVANGIRWTAADLRRFFRGLCALTWEAQRRGCQELQQAQVISTLRDYRLRQSHCGAGVSHIALDAAGNVEPCSTSFNSDGHGRESTFGLYDVDRDPACSACAFRYGCGGGCRAFRREGQPCISDCAPIYLRFVLAMGLVAELPGFLVAPSRQSPREA